MLKQGTFHKGMQFTFNHLCIFNSAISNHSGIFINSIACTSQEKQHQNYSIQHAYRVIRHIIKEILPSSHNHN